jgi:hypothetical protein
MLPDGYCAITSSQQDWAVSFPPTGLLPQRQVTDLSQVVAQLRTAADPARPGPGHCRLLRAFADLCMLPEPGPAGFDAVVRRHGLFPVPPGPEPVGEDGQAADAAFLGLGAAMAAGAAKVSVGAGGLEAGTGGGLDARWSALQVTFYHDPQTLCATLPCRTVRWLSRLSAMIRSFAPLNWSPNPPEEVRIRRGVRSWGPSQPSGCQTPYQFGTWTEPP